MIEFDSQKEIEKLRKDLDALNEEYYRNNFSAHQDFNKSSNFTAQLKVPHYDVRPSTCEVGQIIESSGKLYVCSVMNVWTVVGTQT